MRFEILITYFCALSSWSAFSSSVARRGKQLPLWIRKHECPGQPYQVSKLIDCKVSNYRDKPQEISMVVEVLEPQRRVFLTFMVYMQHQRTRTALYGTTIDVCKVMEDADNGTNQVAKVIVDVARKNFPQVLMPCPYEGLVNASGIRMSSNMILPYTLPGAYRTEVRYYNMRNQTMLAWNTDFELRAVS